jgi:hypothetical protein
MFNQALEITMNNAGSLCTTPLAEPIGIQNLIRTAINASFKFLGRIKAVRQPKMTQEDLTALDGLTAETLKDIGAPEWLQEQVHRAKERAHQGGMFERDSLHWR